MNDNPRKNRKGRASFTAPSGIVTKTISIPVELFDESQRILAEDPEMNFSKYVRSCIRADLAARTKTQA